MAVHGGVVRDDRTWPRWAGVFSVVVVAGAGVAGAWAVATATQGMTGVAVVAGLLVVALAASTWLFRHAFGALVAGRRQPGWSVAAQLGLVVAGFAGFAVDPRLGTAVFAGLFGGMFATNVWAMRHARRNRAAVDAAEAEAERARVQDRAAAAHAPARDSRPAVDVGGVLDGAWRDVWQRWLAWLVAGVVVTGAVVLLTDSGLALFMVPFLGGAVLLWVTRAAWSVALARRDFRLARTPPERAWVVLLDDPTPRMIRPLLGVWSEEPVVQRGVFPKPDLVFRCDDDLDDLLSHQGSVEVHEAWVDTSGRGMRGARWVAADAGVALPHRRAVFGRWFFSSLHPGRAARTRARAALRPARPGRSRGPLDAGLGRVRPCGEADLAGGRAGRPRDVLGAGRVSRQASGTCRASQSATEG